ncbi:MAG: PhoD-like phosphatase N-terminal domain-containing protein, partial [Solirubrobacterales bacterium]|nr:PhoD-like phosphatase N-terminal domain-containing protein [Solirubrobacterales bacterium]
MEGERSVGLTGDWDARISRRTLLRTGGSAAAGLLVLSQAAPANAAPPFAGDPFSLGVASGDPAPDGFVLWTRLAPAPLEG